MAQRGIWSLTRFLQTDVRYLARSTAWLSMGSVIGTAVAFILSLAYARYISKDVYGSYRFILSVIGMAGIFSLPGMSTAIIRAAARGYEGTFRKGSRFIFLSSIGISVVGFITALYYFTQGNTAIAYSLCAASLFVPFVEGLGNWRGYLDGKQAFKKKTLYNAAAHILYGVGMLATIAYIYLYNPPFTISIPLLTFAYFFSHALPNLILHKIIIRRIPKNAPQEESAITYGMHLSLSTAPSTLATYIDSVLLYAYLGPAALAVYSFAIAIPEQIKSLMGNAATVTFPKLAIHTNASISNGSLQQTLPSKLFRASLFTGIVVLGYVILAPILYNFFFPRYIESIPYSQVFALSLILFPFGVFGDALKAEGNVKKIYLHSVGSPLLQIIALAILIPSFGLWGAIAGRVIGRFLNHLFSYVLFKLPSK